VQFLESTRGQWRSRSGTGDVRGRVMVGFQKEVDGASGSLERPGMVKSRSMPAAKGRPNKNDGWEQTRFRDPPARQLP